MAEPQTPIMLIRWRDGDPYGWGPRCRDVDACWERTGANGDEWPLDDGRPRGVVKPRTDHAQIIPLATPEPGLLDFGQAPEVVV